MEVYVLTSLMDCGKTYLFTKEPTELDIANATGFDLEDVKRLIEAEEFAISKRIVIDNEK